MALKRRKTGLAVELEDKENCPANVTAARKATKGEKSAPKSVEVYQKKSQLEHILLRPDSYVGSIERQSMEHWVFQDASGRMEKKTLEYVPALYKIFDEILVNAADNLICDPTQDMIRVEVKRKEGSISVWNNGAGLPVQMHREHQCYVPELVFGQLLTSDNYDDNEKKVVGGRNGYGAKLTNIFSTKFLLETADSKSGKKYKQMWEKNMTVCHKPSITANRGEDYTQVTFFPDFPRFGMKALEEDIVALMRRRAFDVAASTRERCKVVLDGKLLEVSCFQDYVDLFVKPEAFRTCQVVNDRWEVALGLTDGSGFQQVSFVNSINTSRGGTHVSYITDQVVSAVLEKIGKQKNGGQLAVKSQHVKSYLWVFINCLVENPAFDSQTKETLTSKRERFGSACRLPEDLLSEVLESGLLESLQEWSKAMGKSELAQHLNRSDLGLQKRLFSVPKLEDANMAGTKEGHNCTLILTEGDSAKALAVAGLSVLGRDRFGVFPLRGKLRNVRELTVKQMLENKEIDQVLKIMALDATKEYQDAKGLRYGSIMIMTDQDHDGSHIKGLIINFIHHWFPSLLRLPGFLKEFVTPIVKVTKGEDTRTFFTLPEYEAWKEATRDSHTWKCKYYKGLGTSTSAEAREYFADLQDHQIQFTYSGARDDDLIDMAFAAKRSDDRKQWIAGVEDGTFVDHSQTSLSYTDFIEKELVLFAKYDVERAVPCMVDGFKPGQRKVLFGAFKKKLNSEIKVAQFSGYVAEQSAYHHGEASLQGTIIGMAQDFVGSNNVNLFEPRGQFGSRLQGGKDHAASRYIFTCLSKVTRCIFPEEDDAVLEHLFEEGHQIEPRFFCPIIPMVLVNGADGIGTGWSSSIPNYNPRDLISNLRLMLRGEAPVAMTPWYRGFKGNVRAIEGSPGKFEALGVAQQKGRVRLEITELPVKRWTQDYKDWLLEQLPKSGERRSLIEEIREYHSENSVRFVLSMTPDKLSEAERKGFEKSFHLRSSISTSNMWLFDANGNIQKYDTPEDILRAFLPVRLDVYEKRKAFLVAKMERELAVIFNKLSFVEHVLADRLDVEKKKMVDLCRKMRKLGLQHMCDIKGSASIKADSEEEAGAEGFKYLLSMKMWSLTENKVQELRLLHEKKCEALEELKGTSIETMWERDLQRLEEALTACEEKERKEAEAAAKLAAKHSEDSLLVNKQCVLVLAKDFTAKRVRTSEWKARRRGGFSSRQALVKAKKGKEGKDVEVEEGEEKDDVEEESPEALAGVFCCHDFDALLVFSENGFAYILQALDVPLAKRSFCKGTELKAFLPELEDQRVAALVTVPQGSLRDQDDFVVLVSKNGFAKKVSLNRFRGLRPGKGMPAMKLAEGDTLRWAHKAGANSALVLVTAEGFALRISLGQDWFLSTAKGPGKCVMKMRPTSEDHLASCSISEFTASELQQIKEKAAAKAAQAAAAPQEDAEAPDSAPKPENEESDKEAAAEESDQEDEKDDKDEDMEKVCEAAAEAEAPDVAKSSSAVGPCVLLVTENGMGMRIPLNSKRIGLARKGGRGKRVMKVQDDDEVVSACVVSGIQEPLKPLPAWQLYAKDHPEVSEASFEDISADIRQSFQQQADEMKQRYTDELEKYKKEDNEELLLGSSSGAVTRIKVSSVLVTNRLIRGRVVAKTKSDRISVATLLSSMDGDPEEAAKPQEPSQPSQKPLDVSTTSTDAQPAAASAVSTASRPRGRPRGKPSATEASTSAAPQTSPSTSPSEPSQPSQPSHPSQPSQPSQPATAEPAAEVANQLSPGLQSPSLRRRRLSVSQLQQLRSCSRAPVASMSKLKATLRVIKNPFMEKTPKVRQSKLDFRELLKRAPLSVR